jgi:cell division protein FtsB
MPARADPKLGWIRICAVLSAASSIAMVIAALVGQHGVAKHDKLRTELAAVRTLNESLRLENARLHRETEALRSSPELIEAAIRDELGWVRKDEVVIIFSEEAAKGIK